MNDDAAAKDIVSDNVKYSYSTKRQLGAGAFATVFLGSARVKRENGVELLHKVAVKRIEKKRMQTSPKMSRLMQNEITLLRELEGHPNVVRLLDSFENKEHMHLVLEFCDGGDLAAHLKSHAPLSDAVTHNLFSQLAAAVKHTRHHGVVHRDIKPANVLLHRDAARPSGFVAKLSDFGFACRMGAADLGHTFVGSPLHMAPEVLSGSQYDPKIDLWSLGTILYQMATGTTPYRARSIVELKNKLNEAERQGQHLPLPPHASADMIDLVRQLLVLDPRSRIDFAGLFEHPYVQAKPAPCEPLAFTAVQSLAAEVRSIAPHPSESLGVDQGSFVMVDRKVTEFAARLERMHTAENCAVDDRQAGLCRLANDAVHRAILVMHVAKPLGLWERLALYAFALIALRDVSIQAREHLGPIERKGPARQTILAAMRFRDCMEHCLVKIDAMRAEAHALGEQPGSDEQRGTTELVTDGASCLIDRAQRHAERGETVAAESLYRDAATVLSVALTRCSNADARQRIQRYIESTERRLHACSSPEDAARHVGLSILGSDSRVLEHSADTPRTCARPASRPIAIPRAGNQGAAARRGGAGASASVACLASASGGSPGTSLERARFCGACGMRYADRRDVFCQMCGTQRGMITSHGSTPSSL